MTTLVKETNKTTLTFRLNDQLKEELTQEAQAQQLTASAYVEHLMLSRQQGNEGQILLMQSLKERIIQLELENEKLRCATEVTSMSINSTMSQVQITDLTDKIAAATIENKSLRALQYETQEHLKRILQERETLFKFQRRTYPHWFSEEGYRHFIGQITKLKEIHRGNSAEQIVLSAMGVTLENETNIFFVNRLSGFWKQNPHFLTTTQQ